jgi:hypothetical protein
VLLQQNIAIKLFTKIWAGAEWVHVARLKGELLVHAYHQSVGSFWPAAGFVKI